MGKHDRKKEVPFFNFLFSKNVRKVRYSYRMPVEKLILFQKSYDFLLWLYPLVSRLPKHHRAVLGRQIEELGLSILIHILSANIARGIKRKAIQLLISEELDKLRILIRLTKDLRFISIKQYTYAAEKVNEIGKILSGWMQVLPSKVALAKTDTNMTLF
ncbi:MAG: diversity-generating retroelement protein Avd [Candidatus Roizmanbacteria bacterium]|nr:diversity-generating retroelement protein Avd [Candidatus Roizmanbacteria bacterium]